MIRKHVIVRGRVQGVGFRYITSSIASKYHVTGWVRNEYDGSWDRAIGLPGSIPWM